MSSIKHFCRKLLKESITEEEFLTELRNPWPVCQYELTSDASSQEVIPFVVEIVDEKRGRAEVRVKDGIHLDCSSPQYKLNLVAIRCNDQIRSESVPLRISVHDTNDHAPEFTQPWFTFDVDEGKSRGIFDDASDGILPSFLCSLESE
ncbi:unnamed protein product [Anisakis simplex]|uniref:Calsyntenin-1 (inferred by orthology to a D. melanogaster protein) n=1 Tax=Anisakis simplex TaxID=6269 RepID=A0A0M3KE86_ANISI|nr:unnamed protein product [Anisakis simplex]